MDIAKIIEMEKTQLLQEGESRPTLYVEWKETKALHLIAFADFPYHTTFEKQKGLFLLGRRLGNEHPGKSVGRLCFVTEAWVSSVPQEALHEAITPSQDPDRREVLAIQTLDVTTEPVKQECHLVEMLRDGAGNLIDLLPDNEPLDVGYNKLLTAFLAGVISAGMSEKKLARLMAKAMQKEAKQHG